MKLSQRQQKPPRELSAGIFPLASLNLRPVVENVFWEIDSHEN